MSGEAEAIENEEDSALDTMSDEDFLAQAHPGFGDPEPELEVSSDGGAADADEGGDGDEAPAPVQAAGETKAVDGTNPSAVQSHTTPHQPAPDGETPAAGAPDAGGSKAPAEPVDYEATYKQIMAPFKANGKEFTPSSPEEAVRLMQMGANYTKKMQALKPNLQLMRMLENNSLLDESKLSFLIDLDKKDPKAIQKLLHDAKIDPLDLDTSEAPTYTPGNHRVSDQEMQFHEVLGDVATTETGKDTIVLINSKWDQASKQAVFKEPVLLSIINEQRSNGIYDQIVSEIERQQTLGQLPTNVPFIQAYKQVGDRLHTEGKLIPRTASPAAQQHGNPGQMVQRQVLETRTAQPKKPVSNGERAKAAASGPKAASKAPVSFDPFAMSDEEIMAIPAPKI